jgi:hypothetical protein
MSKKVNIKDAVDADKLSLRKIDILVKMALAKMAGIVYVNLAEIKRNKRLDKSC